MHSGGIADKVGNRYEARWLTHELLGLLDGSILSVTVEAIGDDEQGFEFSVERETGTEWHQCKRQTATGVWTIPALASAGVLAAFAGKVAEGGARCLFVSGDPSPQLKLLQDKLPATHDLAAFEASLSQNETHHWSVLQDRMGIDRERLFAFLGATEFRTITEPLVAEILRARLSYWFHGDPDAIAARFRTWLEDDCNFNRPLRFDDLVALVETAKLDIKQHELDRALPGRIRDQTQGYVGSYPPLGAGLFEIERPAVGEILAALETRAGVVLLSGAPGTGKSAILSRVIGALESERILHLAFRVDQAGAAASLDELGAQIIGTADNPVVVLEKLAAESRAVLVIDQVDAVSEVSGRVAELRRVILDLVRKAAQYPRVQLIFSCRTFDLENDHAFREIADRPGHVTVEAKLFERGDVEPVLARLGILYDPASERLMALLCLPIGLSIAASLSRSGVTDLRTVEHLSGLYARLLQVREQEIQREFRPGWSLDAPLTALAAAMSESQELVAPLSVLDAFGGAADILQRAGLIVVRGQRCNFLHESLFDYLHAREFVQRRRSLLEFLLASEQTLFRRTQVRQILAFERELSNPRYLEDLEAILMDRRIRPHIREAVVRWLATLLDPTAAEWDLVVAYAGGEGLPVKTGNVIYQRKPWFELLHRLGILEAWLESEESDLEWALNMIQSGAAFAPAEVAGLFEQLLEKRPDTVQLVFGALRWVDPKGDDAGPLADCLIRALERSTPEDWEAGRTDWDDYYGSWVKTAPADAARICGAQFGRWFRLHPEGHPFKRRYEDGGTAMHWLSELAKGAPLAFLEEMLPWMHLAMQRSAIEGETPAEDRIWHGRQWDWSDTHSPDLLDVVRSALAAAGSTDAEAAARLLRSIEPDRFVTSLHLLLETVAANPAALAPLLLDQLGNPGLFRAGWYCADAYSAGKAIAAVLPHLAPGDAARCEAAVLALRPEIEEAADAIRRDYTPDGDALPEPVARRVPLGGYPSHCLNRSGLRLWSVLRQIGVEQLSPAGAKRLAELDRKFPGVTPEAPDGVRGGMVRSPIDGDRTQHMSDASWLRAMVKFSTPDGRRQWSGDLLRGGSLELARELQARVKEDPERFVKLLPRIPEGASKDFAWGIVAGIAESGIDAAGVEEVLSVVAAHPAARPDDRTLVWLVRGCGAPLGPRAETLLLDICLDDDDSTGIGDMSRSGREEQADWRHAVDKGRSLAAKSLNSARGSALEKLGEICWQSPEDFARYAELLDPVIGKPSAAHIHFALGALMLSGLKHDGKARGDWVLRTARACPEALTSGNARRTVSWLADLDADAFIELVSIYLLSADAEMRAFAAFIIFQRCLSDDAWHDMAGQLIDTDVQFRAAAAAVATFNFQGARYGTLCTDWLTRFFGDEDKLVRREAADCFRQLQPENLAAYIGLFEAFVASDYFEAERSYFLHRLEHAPAAMDDLLLKLLEDVVTASERPGRDARAHELRDVGDLALKLYASNLDDAARLARALDIIDRLVDRGLMDMRKLTMD